MELLILLLIFAIFNKSFDLIVSILAIVVTAMITIPIITISILYGILKLLVLFFRGIFALTYSIKTPRPSVYEETSPAGIPYDQKAMLSCDPWGQP